MHNREFLFDVGKDVGVDVREQVLRDDDLFGADEAFLTSTTREAVPIVTVNDRTIGIGKPGPITWKLLTGFRRLLFVRNDFGNAVLAHRSEAIGGLHLECAIFKADDRADDFRPVLQVKFVAAH